MKKDDSDVEFIATETLIVADIARSVAFYRDVLGATVLREGEPTLLRLKNTWIIINKGGGPTDDKPEVIASPPKDRNTLSSFLNLRVADIKRCYELGVNSYIVKPVEFEMYIKAVSTMGLYWLILNQPYQS